MGIKGALVLCGDKEEHWCSLGEGHLVLGEVRAEYISVNGEHWYSVNYLPIHALRPVLLPPSARTIVLC